MPRPLAVLALVLAAAGCGGGGEETAVRDTAARWLLAVYDSEGALACSLLTPQAAERAARAARREARRVAPDAPEEALPTCATVYGMLGEALGETLAAGGVTRDSVASGARDLLEVTVEGEHAVVAVRGAGRLELVRTGEGWRLDGGLR